MYDEEEIHYFSGGDSVGALLMCFLIIQFVIAARGSLAVFPLFPRNDGDYKKHKKTP